MYNLQMIITINKGNVHTFSHYDTVQVRVIEGVLWLTDSFPDDKILEPGMTATLPAATKILVEALSAWATYEIKTETQTYFVSESPIKPLRFG